jgi:hypothetical protein
MVTVTLMPPMIHAISWRDHCACAMGRQAGLPVQFWAVAQADILAVHTKHSAGAPCR